MDILIAIFTGFAVFLVIWLIYILATPDTVKLKKDIDNSSDAELYSKLFKGSPEETAHKMGISTDKYIFNCNILGVKPHVELLVLMRILAAIILIVGVLIAYLFQNVIILSTTIFVSIFVFISPTATIQSRAKDKQAEFAACIPRFLDLLLTALKIQLPVAQAIELTAKSIDGLLSEEMLRSLAASELGASNWQTALYDIAQKYEVDEFSDFVLDIVTAYDKGTDITESVERQSRDLRQTSLLRAKESASKITSTILLPVVIFKMLPLLVILFLPIVIQLMNGF